MALHPDFPATPYVYVLYTYDHILGDPRPRRGGERRAPPPMRARLRPAPTADGCVVSGRLSRLQAAGNVMTGSEQVLVEDWCQQYPSHSVGTVEFGPDGALYASAGDGASFNFADYGQDGSPVNPCGDPPGGAGAALTPPTAEGGASEARTFGRPAIRRASTARSSASTRRPARPPPATRSRELGPNARSIIAYGLRNPFRFAFRPGTSELWIGDVGWNDWEEINRDRPPDRLRSSRTSAGHATRAARTQAGTTRRLCDLREPLRPAERRHEAVLRLPPLDKVVPGESRARTEARRISGLSFEFAPTGSTFPAEYQGALFFADYSRDCIWAMTKNGNADPESAGHLETFVADAAEPGEPRVRPRWDPLLRRLRRRDDPPGLRHGSTTVERHDVRVAHELRDGHERPRRRDRQLNGDGKLDLASRTPEQHGQCPPGQRPVERSASATNFATGTNPKSVCRCDLNGDGNVDLVTANQNSNTVSVLLGNGNGSFARRGEHSGMRGRT